DDEPSIRDSLAGALEDEGYRTLGAGDGEAALLLLEEESPELVLLDIWMPGRDGLDVLQRIKELHPFIEVMMISGHGTIETAVRATKLGAFDFMEKPLSLERILLQVGHALEHARLRRENRVLRQQHQRRYKIIGDSAHIRDLLEIIERAGPTNGRVLIFGESGTGKELIARAIHNRSNRHAESFIEVNCAAIPEDLIESELFGYEKGAFTGAVARRIGKFEMANGGTIFLDEIGDMSLKTQAKVLRVLEEQKIQRIGGNSPQEIDVRVIAASNKNLFEEIAGNKFREDLFYRLNVIPITAPPLREHKEDIPLLVSHFLEIFAAENGTKVKSIQPEAVQALVDCSWPGNVRELKNTIERLVIMTTGDHICLSDVGVAPAHGGISGIVKKGQTLKEARDGFERQVIMEELKGNDWNVPKTAEQLGIERSNLYKKMKALGIAAPD
ncbi:sigma-54-dependent Fis family transcriptional regulator, partial [bacterium]|nr:sigma-54-dependent Fis family transcriptional regulator [candidate division CSSED10-310 bacterium]